MVPLDPLTTPPSLCELPAARAGVAALRVRAPGTPRRSTRPDSKRAGDGSVGRCSIRPVRSARRASRSACRWRRSSRTAAAASPQGESEVKLVIGEPGVTAERLGLYDRFHAFQRGQGVAGPRSEGAAEYTASFVDNPFDTQEWCYFRGAWLVGVGYVDRLPEGLSAIYFFHDPAEGQALDLDVQRPANHRLGGRSRAAARLSRRHRRGPAPLFFYNKARRRGRARAAASAAGLAASARYGGSPARRQASTLHPTSQTARDFGQCRFVPLAKPGPQLHHPEQNPSTAARGGSAPARAHGFA